MIYGLWCSCGVRLSNTFFSFGDQLNKLVIYLVNHLFNEIEHMFSTRGRHSLVEVDSFLSELAWSVLWILIRLILDHLHPLPTFTLFMTVFTDHIQLADPVLKDRQETNKQTEMFDIWSIVLLGLVRQLRYRWRRSSWHINVVIGTSCPCMYASWVQFWWGCSEWKQYDLAWSPMIDSTV